MAFFSTIVEGIYSVIGNYGWSIMIFTLLVRLILMPFDWRSRVSMRKMNLVQPKIQELQNRYSKDPEKLNRKMGELYKQEGVSPLSGCLPLLLSYPILILMWNAMRDVANQQLVQQVLGILQEGGNTMPPMEGWLWVKNIWMPDSPFSAVLPNLDSLRLIGGDVWTKYFTPEVIATLPGELSALTAESFTGNALLPTVQQIYSVLAQTPVYLANANPMPGWTFSFLGFNLSIMQNYNGYFLLPILSAVSQFAMTAITPQQPTAQQGQQSGQGTMNFMKWFFPLFSLYICASYNGAFALYWVTANLIMMVQTWGINKYLDAKDAKKAAVAGEGSIK